jgi:hypothetical protein
VEVTVDSRHVAEDVTMAVTVDMDMATVDSLEVTRASGEVVVGKTMEEARAMLAGTINQCRLALIMAWLHPITRGRFSFARVPSGWTGRCHSQRTGPVASNKPCTRAWAWRG